MKLYEIANLVPDTVKESGPFQNPFQQVEGAKDSGKSPQEELQELGITIFMPSEKNQYLDWDYLAGYEDVKQKIEESVLLTLEHPKIYEQILHHTRVKQEPNKPKAILFEGPPGTGKTTSAKIIAHQVKIPLVYVPLDSIVSQYYGQAEKNLANVFSACKRLGKCIIFIDEIDSLAQSRDKDMHEATRRVLSVFLRHLDGFESSEDTMVISATNRKEDLDAALQSRFSVVITFAAPDEKARAGIFKRYAKQLTQEQLLTLGQISENMTGRDIKACCEDAERKWAAKMLKGETKNPQVSFEVYKQSVQQRIQSIVSLYSKH